MWVHGLRLVDRTSGQVLRSLNSAPTPSSVEETVQEEKTAPSKPGFKVKPLIIEAPMKGATCLTALDLDFYTAPAGSSSRKQLLHKVGSTVSTVWRVGF